MRFRKLDLTAFGHFTDATIDLSAGQFGLHMIFGPNEAGKSSSLRALTDFLYGIPGRTNDSFLHPYTKMRIGGTIERSDDTSLQCIRRKGNQGTLRDQADVAIIAESEMQSYIGDVDRDLFCSMFGIDHATLRQGGEEIARGGGQLGTILFSSASGLAGLREIQASFVENIDRVFKSSGRSGSLVESINGYKAKKDQQKETQVSADAYNKHVHGKQDAVDLRDKLDREIYAKQVDQGRLERVANSVQAIASWRTAKTQLDAIGTATLLPEEFSVNSNKLVGDLLKFEQQKRSKKADIEAIDLQLQQLPKSGQILSLADRIEEIKVRLGEYRKGNLDITRNENFLQQNEREARNILRTMMRSDDLTNVEELRVPADKIVRIQSLGNKYEGLEARVESNSEELAKLRRQITKNEEKLNETSVSPSAMTLRAKVQQIQRQGDLETQAAKLRADNDRLAAEIESELQRLPLWKGTADALAALAIPSIVTIQRFENEWMELDSEIKAVRKRKLDAAKQDSVLARELARLEANQSIPSQLELEDKRRTRDSGWKLIRSDWLDRKMDEQASSEFVTKFSGASHLSDAFEQSIMDADGISDQLRIDADRVANKSRILLDLKQQSDQIEEIESELKAFVDQQQRLEESWTLQWQSLQIQPLPPREMRSWVLDLSGIVERVSSLGSKRKELDTIEVRIASCQSDLRRELETVGVALSSTPATLQDMLELAQQTEKNLQVLEKSRALYSAAIAKAEAEAEDAEASLEKAKSALDTWKSEWATEMQRIGLEPNALSDQANQVLNSIKELFQKLHEADGFRKRNLGIDRDAKRFVIDIQQIASEASPELASLPVEDLILRLTAELESARKNEAIRNQLVLQRESAAKHLQAGEQSHLEVLDQVGELCRLAGCSKYEDLQLAAELSQQRRGVTGKIEILEAQILKNTGNKSLEDFLVEVEIEAENPDSIAPRIEQLERDIRQLLNARDEAVQGIEREANALEALNKNDQVANLATECESIAATIEDQFRELAVLRTCAAVLAAGVERFREKNQDPVLLSAASNFQAMTCGAFSGLRADLDEQGKAILVGIRAQSGDSVQVTQMSDGTCDQLYLALRLASLESWLDRHEPIPFVVDDILLNFDNQRALATLERLIELSTKTQVIFFTHHHHLVELAQQHLANDKLFVHQLPNSQPLKTS